MNEAISSVLEVLDTIANLVAEVVEFVDSLFTVDFSILYSWLPADIANTFGVIIGLFLILALFGLVKRILLR